MDIQSRREDNCAVVALTGRLDTVSAPTFEAYMRDQLAGDELRLVVDCECLEYISSAGLRVLLLLEKALSSEGGQLCLAGVRGNVRSVFDMAHFSDMFRIEESVADALAALT